MNAKALLVRELGPPARHRIETIAVPSPGPGEARVAITAACVNFPDLLMLEGRYQYRPDLPFVAGMEAAGRIVELGPGPSALRPGDRVVMRMRSGLFAEQATLPQSQLLPAPDSLTDAEAACLMVASVTAIHALSDRGKLKAGETLLVHGAAGGVGLAAVEFGILTGARVIAVCAGPEKAAVLAAKGAHHVIDRTKEDFRARVLEITEGRGADVIYDPVGGEAFHKSLRCIAWSGRLLVVGFASGTIPSLKANLALLKGCSVIGLRAGENARRNPASGAANEARAFEAVQAGVMRPLVSHQVPLERFHEAFAIVGEGRAIGRVALTMN